MRGAWMAVAVCVLALAFVPAAAMRGGPEVRVGIGAKVLQTTPFVLAAVRVDSLGIEAGAGMARQSFEPMGSMSLFYYTGLGKYYVPIPDVEWLYPYAGAGVLGLSIKVEAYEETGTASVLGLDVLGGSEFRFGPMAFFAGLDWLMFGDIGVQADGVGEAPQLGLSGLAFHVGARYDF